MHFRTKKRAQSKFAFKFDGNSLEYCKEYKYLGLCNVGKSEPRQ